MDNISLGNFTTIDTVLAAIKKLRSQYKNNWVCFNLTYNGTPIEAKLYGTWLQILRCMGGNNAGNCMDQTVKQFNEHLSNFLTRC